METDRADDGRPECRRCGRPNKTPNEYDGLCYSCSCATKQAPPVRCGHCHRIRYALGEDWQDHPAKLPDEVAGTCRTCADLLARTREAQWWREGRELLRQRERGYGPAPEGEDVFLGFRDEESKA